MSARVAGTKVCVKLGEAFTRYLDEFHLGRVAQLAEQLTLNQ